MLTPSSRCCLAAAASVLPQAVGQATAPATSIGMAVFELESSEWTSQRPRDGLSERFISAPSSAVFSKQSDNSSEFFDNNLVDTNAPT